MSLPPKYVGPIPKRALLATTRKRVRFDTLRNGLYPPQKRHLFKCTIPTSIDSWEEFIVARDEEEVKAVLNRLHPEGFIEGWEPQIVQLDYGMDSIYVTR